MKSKILQFFLMTVFYNTSAAQELLSNESVQDQISVILPTFDLPQQVDALTTLVAVDLLAVRGISYTYQLDAEGGNAEENEQGFRAIKATVVQALCNNLQMIWYKQNFVDMEYIYLDKSGNVWYRTRINSNDC